MPDKPLPYSPSPVPGRSENTAASRVLRRTAFLAGSPAREDDYVPKVYENPEIKWSDSE